jgi:hypothetical protein
MGYKCHVRTGQGSSARKNHAVLVLIEPHQSHSPSALAGLETPCTELIRAKLVPQICPFRREVDVRHGPACGLKE